MTEPDPEDRRRNGEPPGVGAVSKGSRPERLLVVDDDRAVVDYLVEELADRGFEVRGTLSPLEALDLVERQPFDLIVADIEMAELRGLDLVARVHEKRANILVVLITAFGSIDLAVQAMRVGASDFVTKPFPIEHLVHSIERSLRERSMRREIVRLRGRLASKDSGGLVARSERMRSLLDTARRAAAGGATILLTGESGTGKGVLARFIHEQGPRGRGPFIHVNCAALPEGLVESELFGVKRGAYTDAREGRDGMFVEARGGTLFLDEIGEMPLGTQAKLLHALEAGRVRPLGGEEVASDARVIAATNRPLEDALRERRFRPDLYFRLNVIRLDLPPLRERREDIPDLVDVLLERAVSDPGRSVVGVSETAMRWLLRQDWPGNVRELANIIEGAVALSEHDTLLVEDLAAVRAPSSRDEGILGEAVTRRMPLAEVERAYARKILETVGGNMAEAARILGIDRRTLYRKMAEDS